MSGGTFRLFDHKYYFIENDVLEAALPYVNGADFTLSLTPSSSTQAGGSAFMDNLL